MRLRAQRRGGHAVAWMSLRRLGRGRLGRDWAVEAIHRRGHSFDLLRVGQIVAPPASQGDDKLFRSLFIGGCVKPEFGPH